MTTEIKRKVVQEHLRVNKLLKMKIFLLVFMILSCICARQQDNNSFHDLEAYLIKKVLLMYSDTGSIIIIPLKKSDQNNINHTTGTQKKI